MSTPSESDQESAATVPEGNVSHPPAGTRSRWTWPLALFVAAALAVVAMNYGPQPFVLPERLSNISMNSPLELHEESAEQTQVVHWQNSLLDFGLAGACLGLVSLFMAPWQKPGRAALAVIGCVAAGAVCGMVAVGLGLTLRDSLEAFASGDKTLRRDLLVWTVMSVLLALPAGFALLLAGESFSSQKVMAVPLAGLLTGLLLPIVISVLLPTEKTSIVPPSGLLITGAWMAVLAIFLFLLTTFTGSKAPRKKGRLLAAEKPA